MGELTIVSFGSLRTSSYMPVWLLVQALLCSWGAFLHFTYSGYTFNSSVVNVPDKRTSRISLVFLKTEVARRDSRNLTIRGVSCVRSNSSSAKTRNARMSNDSITDAMSRLNCHAAPKSKRIARFVLWLRFEGVG